MKPTCVIGDEYDVIVIGSGGAALAGALAAVSRGLTTLVLEKSDRFGGTSAYSGGSIWLPGNHVLARDGVEDSVARGLTYFTHLVGERTPAAVQRAFLDTGPELAEFLEQAGIPLEHRAFPDYFDAPGRGANGRSIFAQAISADEVGERVADIRPGVPADQFGIEVDRSVLDGGQSLIARLILALDASGLADLRLATAAKELICESTERVSGVRLAGAAGERTVRARAGVLVAAGGFERSSVLRARHQQMPTADWSSSHPDTGAGDALTMVADVGADLDLLDQSWWCPAVLFPNGHAAFTLGIRSGIFVDAAGNRFVNEMSPYDQSGRAMRAVMQSGVGDHFWFVFDDTAGPHVPAICVPDPHHVDLAAAGLWHTAESVGDLAMLIDVDPTVLAMTVERFNGMAAAGRDEDFSRGEDPFGRFFLGASDPSACIVPLNVSRLHAVRLVLGDLGTKGGAVINADGAVLRPDGSVIEGLYAAGNSSASVAGEVYPGPGTPLGSGMVMSYRAVADMAAKYAALPTR